MNFVEVFKQGKEGKNISITTGSKTLDLAINRIQQGKIIGIAGGEKTGKTAFTDYHFLLAPYIEMAKNNTLQNIEWIYHSFEIGRVQKEFKFAAFFMAYDYGVYNFIYKDKLYLMNKDYLMGKQLHENRDESLEIIPVSVEHEEMLKSIYINRIIPLFGEYTINNIKIKNGLIDFIEEPINPTGIDKYILSHARKNGNLIYENYTTINQNKSIEHRQRLTGYTPNNPDKFTIVITDHVRKLLLERGFSMKENIDKFSSYTVTHRNILNYIFIHVIHTNRGISNIDRLKFAGEYVYPTSDDVKDTGNIGEDCNFLITLFNPNDEKYNLDKHMGIELKDYPNYRSAHLAASRDTEYPVHIQMNMFGNINMFTKLY